MTRKLVSTKHLAALAGPCLLLALLAAPGTAFSQSDPVPVEIVVAPNVINVNSAAIILTVHTNIAYDLVVDVSDPDYVPPVSLGDDGGRTVDISWWKADDRGNFVAKFELSEVNAQLVLYPDEFNTLTLHGWTVAGAEFEGSDSVKVVARNTSR